MPRHGRLIRLPRRVECPFVSRGHQLHSHVRQRDAGAVVHDMPRAAKRVFPRGERRAKRHIVDEVSDVGELAVERVRVAGPGQIDAEAEEGRGAAPRVGAD